VQAGPLYTYSSWAKEVLPTTYTALIKSKGVLCADEVWWWCDPEFSVLTLTLLINAARGATTRLEALPNETEGAARTFTVEESILCDFGCSGL
jgi:hypothetical protein